MCFHPIKIVNKSDRVGINSKPVMMVPCGRCDECLESKKKQYYVRTFAEYQDILPFLDLGQGMVYFDTLTYSNKFLPLWHGIMVFNHRHIQLFLKRLRKSLVSAGYSVENNLRYFICSEYGDTTKRPHYHVLFFVRFKIDPEIFWDYINKAWIYGHIDRKYQKWVKGKLCKGALQRVVDGNGALKYVSGYVVKDKNFMKIFDDKVAELVASGYDVEDSILRSLKPRFFLSRGFGLSFIEDQSAKFHFKMDYYEQTGKITISDFKYLKQDFALPQYYKRKIFFDCRKQELPGKSIDPVSGLEKPNYRISWIPNQTYLDFLKRNYQNIIDGASDKLYNSYINLSDKYDGLLGKSLREYVSEKLGDRTFKDLAIYQQFYCYRLGYTCIFPFNIDHWLFRFIYGNRYSIDHLNKYTENDSIDKLQPYIITDRSSRAFQDFDEILQILDGFSQRDRKNRLFFILAQRAERRKTRYRTKSFY